jgi:hypothetical protein
MRMAFPYFCSEKVGEDQQVTWNQIMNEIAINTLFWAKSLWIYKNIAAQIFLIGILGVQYSKYSAAALP